MKIHMLYVGDDLFEFINVVVRISGNLDVKNMDLEEF
jgi:hypothetical protein